MVAASERPSSTLAAELGFNGLVPGARPTLVSRIERGSPSRLEMNCSIWKYPPTTFKVSGIDASCPADALVPAAGAAAFPATGAVGAAGAAAAAAARVAGVPGVI